MNLVARRCRSQGCGSMDCVSVLPSGNAWAVGSPPILRCNGSAWHRVPLT
jgi:hypothetical protein